MISFILSPEPLPPPPDQIPFQPHSTVFCFVSQKLSRLPKRSSTPCRPLDQPIMTLTAMVQSTIVKTTARRMIRHWSPLTLGSTGNGPLAMRSMNLLRFWALVHRCAPFYPRKLYIKSRRRLSTSRRGQISCRSMGSTARGKVWTRKGSKEALEH